jgi:hypothetical protein
MKAFVCGAVAAVLVFFVLLFAFARGTGEAELVVWAVLGCLAGIAVARNVARTELRRSSN